MKNFELKYDLLREDVVRAQNFLMKLKKTDTSEIQDLMYNRAIDHSLDEIQRILNLNPKFTS